MPYSLRAWLSGKNKPINCFKLICHPGSAGGLWQEMSLIPLFTFLLFSLEPNCLDGFFYCCATSSSKLLQSQVTSMSLKSSASVSASLAQMHPASPHFWEGVRRR